MLGAKLSSWLSIDSLGRPTERRVDKYRLGAELGVPSRDIRLLDPSIPTPYPSAILVRERAIVLNLDSAKAIVTKDTVWLLSVRNAASLAPSFAPPSSKAPLVRELCRRLAPPDRDPATAAEPRSGVDASLAYELRAFEVILSESIKRLECEATALEGDATTVLELFTRKVSRATSEPVRAVKARQTRLADRVSKLKEEIEAILDDESELIDMNLSRKAELEARALATTSDESDESDPDGSPGHGGANSRRNRGPRRGAIAKLEAARQGHVGLGLAPPVLPVQLQVAAGIGGRRGAGGLGLGSGGLGGARALLIQMPAGGVPGGVRGGGRAALDPTRSTGRHSRRASDGWALAAGGGVGLALGRDGRERRSASRSLHRAAAEKSHRTVSVGVGLGLGVGSDSHDSDRSPTSASPLVLHGYGDSGPDALSSTKQAQPPGEAGSGAYAVAVALQPSMAEPPPSRGHVGFPSSLSVPADLHGLGLGLGLETIQSVILASSPPASPHDLGLPSGNAPAARPLPLPFDDFAYESDAAEPASVDPNLGLMASSSAAVQCHVPVAGGRARPREVSSEEEGSREPLLHRYPTTAAAAAGAVRSPGSDSLLAIGRERPPASTSASKPRMGLGPPRPAAVALASSPELGLGMASDGNSNLEPVELGLSFGSEAQGEASGAYATPKHGHGHGHGPAVPCGLSRRHRRDPSASGSDSSSSDSTGTTSQFERETEVLQDLLEAYLLEVDSIFRRLVLLKERVDDTEDLVKIELDSKLSDLFVLEVLVTSTTLAFAAANLVCSFLGMNVHNNVEDSTLAFILVVVLSLSGIVISTAAFVWYLRRRFQFGLPDAPLPQVTTGYYRRRVEEEE